MKTTHTKLAHEISFVSALSISLAFRLFIVLNLDSFHEIFFKGARIRRRMTFATHEN